MKAKRTLSSYVLLVGVMGLSIVGGVLAYQIYSAAVKSQTTPEQKEIIKSIDGSISQAVIDNLKGRTVYSETELEQNLTVEVTPEPTIATIAATPIASPSATIPINDE